MDTGVGVEVGMLGFVITASVEAGGVVLVGIAENVDELGLGTGAVELK
jgi:hypothetical protein